MTTKDTGFIQQHIEKVVLGVALLFVLIVLWLYYLGNPYRVTLANRDDVAPAEVMDVVQQRAQVLKGKLEVPESPLPPTPVPDYTQEFIERFQRPLLAMDSYPIALSEPGLGDFRPEAPKTRYVIMPPVPAPTQVKARSGYNVLAEPEDPQQIAPYVQLIGDQTPRDFDFSSVSAVFSIDELQQAIKDVPIDDRIPESWWKNRLMVVRVELQRSELDPLTGQWSDEVTVPPLPNQVAYGIEPKAEYQQIEATRIIDQLPLEQDLIQRPPFPPTINEWTPPDIDVAQRSPEDNRKLMTLDGDIGRLRRQIQSLEKRGQSGAAGDRPARPGVRGTLDMERATAGVTRPPAGSDAASQIEHLRAQLIQKVNERNQLLGLDSRATDGFGRPQPSGDEIDGRFNTPTRGQQDPNAPQGGPPGEIKVWAHDLTVEAGKTYRYRLIVHIFNPLFQKRGIDPEQEKENFHKLSIASLPSAWSDPVVTEPEIRFFLVRAGSSSAEIEVYRIFNGGVEMRNFTVRPGEMIGEDVEINTGGMPVKLPMKINGMLVDLREVSTGGAIRDSTYEMLYVDLANGNLNVRNLNQDQNDPDLLRLRAERARDAVALQP